MKSRGTVSIPSITGKFAAWSINHSKSTSREWSKPFQAKSQIRWAHQCSAHRTYRRPVIASKLHEGLTTNAQELYQTYLIPIIRLLHNAKELAFGGHQLRKIWMGSPIAINDFSWVWNSGIITRCCTHSGINTQMTRVMFLRCLGAWCLVPQSPLPQGPAYRRPLLHVCVFLSTQCRTPNINQNDTGEEMNGKIMRQRPPPQVNNCFLP